MRSHPNCWVEDRYEHICMKPTGKYCIEQGCHRVAGTDWGPLWCPEHDVERLDRISGNLDLILARLEGK